jgi:hypothetical protein
MGAPTAPSEGFATWLKRWLLAEYIELLGGSYEHSDQEHQQPQGELASGRTLSPEPVVAARGEIRLQEVPLLAHYGTSYALFDEWSADYECVLVSDLYRLEEYVGDSVWVSGPLEGAIEGMPLMKVTHLELLKMKWML